MQVEHFIKRVNELGYTCDINEAHWMNHEVRVWLWPYVVYRHRYIKKPLAQVLDEAIEYLEFIEKPDRDYVTEKRVNSE